LLIILNFVLYVFSHNLLAESKCVDIILHCQHHKHASYMKGSKLTIVICLGFLFVYCVIKDCILSVFVYISINKFL